MGKRNTWWMVSKSTERRLTNYELWFRYGFADRRWIKRMKRIGSIK